MSNNKIGGELRLTAIVVTENIKNGR